MRRSAEFQSGYYFFTESLKLDPTNKEAYYNRAVSYFESGLFDLAADDYIKSKDILVEKVDFFEISKDFKESLMQSLLNGATDAAVDFVPSLCNTTYGIGKTLWALSNNPLDSLNEFIKSCYELSQSIEKFCNSVDVNTVDECIDQIKSIYLNYDQLNEAEKGNLIGYSVGKYGVEFLAGGAIFKGISSYNKLRTANRICNLEALASSKVNKETITSSALKHNSERNSFFKNIKIEIDKQNKHIVGKHNFQPGKSVLEHNDPQKLLSEFAGKGKPIRGIPGKSGYQEIVNFNEVIGFDVNIETGLSTPTTWGKIHYSNTGAHIVPYLKK